MRMFLFPITVLFFIYSCHQSEDENKLDKKVSYRAKIDTVNITDTKGFKQGKWIVRDSKLSAIMRKEILIESGNYVDNKKQGIWNYYDSSGKVMRIIEYKDDQSVKK